MESFIISGIGPHTKGRLTALPTNIILVWKGLTVTNTLAYYNTELVNNVKSVIVRTIRFAKQVVF
jgi:hypothetical protein